MKFKFTLLSILLSLFVSCQGNVPDTPAEEEDNPTEQTEDNPVDDSVDDSADDPADNPAEDPDDEYDENYEKLPDADFVAVTDSFQVMSTIIESFLKEVTYDERDYSYTLVTNYEGGAPGEEDKPNSFVVSWEAEPASGELKLTLTDGEWTGEKKLKKGTASVNLTNLVPGRTYTYKIVGANYGRILAQGSFPTKGMRHLVNFSPLVRNARDLGGVKTTDGRTVAFRKLYRGGLITGGYMDNAGKADMLFEGIRAELDLRESSDAPSSSPLGSDVTFYNSNMEKAYGTLLREYKPKVKKAFDFVVKCVREGRPLYFHCSLGRDRTGTMTVLIYGLLGVSESEISKDYELLYFAPEKWSLNGKTTFTYSRTQEYGLSYACDFLWNPKDSKRGKDTTYPEDYTDDMTFKDRTERYLLNIGVSQTDIDDFRSMMLE